MSSVTSHIAAADRITTYSQEVDARTWGGFMSNQCLAVVGRVGRETEQVTRRIKRAFPQQTDLGGPYPTSQEVLPLAILFFVESDLMHLDLKLNCQYPGSSVQGCLDQRVVHGQYPLAAIPHHLALANQ